MAFAPAQNHEIKFSISLIHQVPSVPAKHHKSLEKTKKMCHFTDVEKNRIVPGTPGGECAASLRTESETESFVLS